MSHFSMFFWCWIPEESKDRFFSSSFFMFIYLFLFMIGCIGDEWTKQERSFMGVIAFSHTSLKEVYWPLGKH